jgi:hypothetical protein
MESGHYSTPLRLTPLGEDWQEWQPLPSFQHGSSLCHYTFKGSGDPTVTGVNAPLNIPVRGGQEFYYALAAGTVVDLPFAGLMIGSALGYWVTEVGIGHSFSFVICC